MAWQTLLLRGAPVAYFVAVSLWVITLAVTDPDRLLGFVPDDAFYYFGVAKHWPEGWWFSFDGVTRTNGFHPLWAVTITPVMALAPHTFVPVLLLGAAFTAVAIRVFAWTIAHVWDRQVGASVAVLMATNPMVVSYGINGLETGLLLCTVALLTQRVFCRSVHTTRDAVWLGVLMAAVCLTRTDAAFAAGALWLVAGLRQGRGRVAWRLLWQSGTVAAILVAPWLIFNLIAFGSVIQDSGRVFVVLDHRFHEFHESLDVLAGRPGAIARSALASLGTWWGLGHWLIVTVTGVVGGVAFVRRGLTAARVALVLVFTGVTAGIIGSGAWRLVIREWYVAPVIVLPMVFLALAVSLPRRRAAHLGLLIAASVALIVNGRTVLSVGLWPDQHVEPTVIRAAAAVLPEHALVGNSDAGMWGWFAPFTTINLDGLANAEALAAIERGRLFEYIDNRGLTAFVFGRDWWRRPWLMGHGSLLRFDDQVLESAGRRPDGTMVVLSHVLRGNAEIVARYGRSHIDTSHPDFGRWLGAGWAAPAAGQEVWSTAPQSDLYLPIDTSMDMDVTLWLNAFGGPEGRRRVTVTVNGHPAAALDVAGAEAHRPYLVRVPKSDAPLVTLGLAYDRTWQPSALGASTDQRHLAVSITRITTAVARGPRP